MLLHEWPKNCQFGNHMAGFPPHVLDTLKLKKGNGAARTTTGLWSRSCILEFYATSLLDLPYLSLRMGAKARVGVEVMCEGNGCGRAGVRVWGVRVEG